MKRTLEYTICLTRNNAPLVTLDSPHGNGQEIEPNAVRALARALLDIVAKAEQKDLEQHYLLEKGVVGFE